MSNKIITKTEMREELLKKCPFISSVLNECTEEEKVNMDNRYHVSTREKNLDEDYALLVLAKKLLEDGAIRKTRYIDTVSFTNERNLPVHTLMIRYDILVTKLPRVPGMDG